MGFYYKQYGRSILTRIAHLSTDQLARSEAFFERQGAKAVIIARFIPVVRSASAYLAGINQIPPRQFALFNVIGGLLWAVLIGNLGFVFGSNLTLLETVLKRVAGVFAAVLLTGLFFLWLNYRWRQNQRRYQSGRIGMAFSWLQTRWRQTVENGTRWLLVYGLIVIVSSLAQAHLSDVLAGLPLGLLWLGIVLALASDEMGQYGRQLKTKTSVMSTRNRFWLLVALTILVLVLTFIQPPIAQDPSYHHFADTRSLWGITNFYNVVSNAAFLIAGLIGLRFLQQQRRTGHPLSFLNWQERRPYLILFIAVAITCFGSAFYHLNPNDAHLVWDRLPMTFGFVSLFVAIIMERIDAESGFRLLTPLVILRVASVLYWYWGDRVGGGDLRLYVDVQFYPLLAIPLLSALFPSRYTEGKQIFIVIFLYGLAKLFEVLDKPIFALFNCHISGHTLKHVVAALAIAWIVWVLSQREPVIVSKMT